MVGTDFDVAAVVDCAENPIEDNILAVLAERDKWFCSLHGILLG
jgi:hypothetical protein